MPGPELLHHPHSRTSAGTWVRRHAVSSAASYVQLPDPSHLIDTDSTQVAQPSSKASVSRKSTPSHRVQFLNHSPQSFCPGPRSPLLPVVLGPPACSAGGGTTQQGQPIYPNGNRGKCLDLRGECSGAMKGESDSMRPHPANERYDGNAVQIYDCNGSSAQRWVINRGSGQGTYRAPFNKRV
jgi:hypothetical protein